MFKILDYIDSLEVVKDTETHFTCVCPVCGDDNFKIKRTSPYKNAYRCWSNHCDNKKIQEALGFKSLLPTKKSKPLIRIKPREIPFTGSCIAEISNYQPIKVKTKRFSGGYTSEERVYQYSPSQRVLRIDNVQSKTKYIYIQYQNQDFVWVSGAGDSFWPVYSYGVENSLSKSEFDTVLMVEGEKTAEFCKERGISAITLMAGNFHNGLNKSIMLFGIKYPNIKNIIYVPDADAPGLIKAKKVQESCWRNKFGCKIVTMSKIVTDPFEGMDLADVEENTFNHFKNDITASIRRNSAHLAAV